MESVKLNDSFNTSAPSIANFIAINQLKINNDLSSSIPYIEIMLCEYYHMVNSLTKLDATQLQSLQDEVNKVLTKLTTWLDKVESNKAVELFSALHHLKQKANSLTSALTEKSAITNIKNPLIAKRLGHIAFTTNNHITAKQQNT